MLGNRLVLAIMLIAFVIAGMWVYAVERIRAETGCKQGFG